MAQPILTFLLSQKVFYSENKFYLNKKVSLYIRQKKCLSVWGKKVSLCIRQNFCGFTLEVYYSFSQSNG